MAKLGLLGALGGLGQAITGFGADLAKRREAALAAAQRMAEEQRARAAKIEDREDAQAAQLTERSMAISSAAAIAQERNRVTTETTAAKITAASDLTERKITATSERDDKKIAADQTIAERKIAAARDLAVLKGKIGVEHARLKEKLDNDDVVGTKPGNEHPDPKKKGFYQVMTVRKDGSVKPTGEYTRPWNPDAGAAVAPSLGYKYPSLDDDEDEDEDE